MEGKQTDLHLTCLRKGLKGIRRNLGEIETCSFVQPLISFAALFAQKNE